MIPVLGVPVLAHHALLGRMLATIDADIETLLIVDNAGRVGQTALPHVGRTYWLSMPSNLGVPASWNLIIKSTPHAPYWILANFDITWPAGSLERLADAARPDALVLSGGSPPWCAVAIGEDVVDTVGLFDEGIYPAYCEDNDYERRVRAAGLDVVETHIPVAHRNSSTIAAGYRAANDRTYPANVRYYEDKVRAGDLSEGRWSLRRRRLLSWEPDR